MRMSRVIIGGAVIAAAVAGGSAYTAANTLEDNTVAGYDDAVVTGATVNNIAYTPAAADPSFLDLVVFTAAGDLTDTQGTMVLRSGGSAVAGSATTCATGAHDAVNDVTPFTCDLATNVEFIDFDGVGLTVGSL